MPIETPQGNLDIKNATLRTSNLETQNIKIGSIFVGTGNSLEETANVGNSMSNTIQFTNTHTAFTTTGNVEVGKELTVSGNVSDLNVVSNVNLLHTSNTAALKLNSNVVTEFPRSKKLIKYPRVALTQNDESGTSGYVAEQTNYSGYPADGYAYRLFDNTSGAYQSGSVYSGGNPTASAPTTTASDGSTHQGVAITLDLVTKIRLDHVVFTSHANYGRTPVDGTFLGSNNSSTWDVIHTFSGLSTSSNNQKHTINITNSSQKLAYRYIRFVITKIHTSSVFNGGGLLEFRELEYYGVPEYDPEADGVDVVVKSVPNVPNTDWLEVYYDAKDYTSVTTTVDNKTGVSAHDITISNSGGTITFNDEYKAWTFGGTDAGPGVESTRTDTFIATMPSSFSGNQVHSVSTWFRYEQTFGDDAIFSISPSNGEDTNKSIGVRLNEGQDYEIKYYHWGNDLNVNFPRGHTANTWYHMVVTYTGSITDERRGKSVYINGELCPFVSETTTGELNLDGADQLQLARRNDGEKEFFGSIANFRLFNRALTTDEIYQLYAYQKEYFGHGVLGMTLKAGRLGIGTSEPKAALDVRGTISINGQILGLGRVSGGNDIFDVDGYRVHVFTTSGNFWVLSSDLPVDILLVGGGGGGGQDNAGGGGAGGLIFKPDHGLQVGGYTVIIGSGGSGCPHQNNGPEAKVGGNTEIKRLSNGSSDLVAYGGGAGMNGGSEQAAERNGGSGGGGASETTAPTGGGTATQTGTYNYGNNGGTAASDAGGGGGGAGAVGQNGSVDGAGYGGTGGDGLNGVTGYDFAEIFGTRYGELIGEDVWFAGGGAGANINYTVDNNVGGSFRRGGKGGGGSGPIVGERYVEVKSGLPNTGGGGCGATWFDVASHLPRAFDLHGGDGGSGIVIFRYKL